ncbi:unnamed protein product [Polarella glacialis]|uniref:MYND-type domain-containing protein n=1 Tax=Polarella glacialis TaxID=89957 RepID=A0A813LNK6_POLGL|nr:unnamed protein product [Polarella glacialis]CAE8734393.1 unnamed protein product [Polarella glacialis]
MASAPDLPLVADALSREAFDAALAAGCGAFAALRRCVETSGEPCEGNIMHTWNSWAQEPTMEAKQRNLFALARSLSVEEGRAPLILEVGFNAGHSVCLMLLANPNARVVAFDLCEHSYTKPCAEALQSFFGKQRLELWAGPSAETLSAFRRQRPGAVFDLFHVDGGHRFQDAAADLAGCWRLGRLPPEPRSWLVLDDVDITGVRAAWDDFAALGRILERRSPHALLGRYRHAIGELVADEDDQAGRSCRTCGACGGLGAAFACGGCRQVRYCSEACGRGHWRQHRSVCEARRRQPPAISPLEEISPCASLLSSGPGGSLAAAQDLSRGQVLFLEPPLSWQPAGEARAKLCAHCGMASESGLQRCGECGQVGFCSACTGQTCHLCPELSITQGHVAPFTLVALDVLRRWEQGELPADALPRPVASAQSSSTQPWKQEVTSLAERVQKVAHFCSAVRWSEQRAEEVLEAVLCGQVDLTARGQNLGVGYYSKFARLKCAPRASPGPGGSGSEEGNVSVEICPSPAHTFSLKAVLRKDVPRGAPVTLRM